MLGVIGVADAIKADSATAIRRLHDAGVGVMMVTGDVETTARAIAEKTGIDDFRSSVLPEDKARLVEEMRQQGYVVAMVGDGTIRNIHQNLFGAFIYNTLGIPIAAGVLYPVWGILMSPILAGAAMSLSSVTVVTNANRLRLFRTTQPKGGNP